MQRVHNLFQKLDIGTHQLETLGRSENLESSSIGKLNLQPLLQLVVVVLVGEDDETRRDLIDVDRFQLLDTHCLKMSAQSVDATSAQRLTRSVLMSKMCAAS